MKIRFIGHRARDVVPATGAREFTVSPGDVVDVDDVTARSLLDQPAWFERVPEPRPQAQAKTKENS